jgi:RNA polymerase sigma-70 factor (ECF subfamily)
MGANGHDMGDGELIRRYLDGDEAAFECLYDRYRKPLYSFLNSMLPGQSAAVDDLYQQTWLRALRGLAGYRHSQRFISWLFRIARNLAIDHVRRRSRAEEVPLSDALPAGPDGIPGRDVAHAERGEALRRAINGLPDDLREVLLMRQQGMPFKEIAVIQRVSINTVLGRMRYAVLRLRKTLADWQ